MLGLVDKCINNTEVTSILTMDGTDFGLNYESALSEQKKFDPYVFVDEREPFKICYTSGTTGEPKGITISHRSRLSLIHI